MQSHAIIPLNKQEVSKIVERIQDASSFHPDGSSKLGPTVKDVAEGIGASPEVVAQHLEIVRLQIQLDQLTQFNSDLNLRISALEKKSQPSGFLQFLRKPGGAMTAVFIILSLGFVWVTVLLTLAHANP